MIGISALPPVLAGLSRLHTDLRLELSLTDTVEDLL
jgi:DNA-binding transcriptional LysR family regulator